MSKYTPTKLDLANGWLKLRGCMLQTFAHHLWLRHFKPTEGDSREYPLHEECHIVERGTLASVLVNIRIINDFFSHNGFETDIRASQFPNFRNPGPFLTKDEETNLNKHIAHLTKERVSIESMAYCPLDFIIRANERFELFAAFIKDEFLNNEPSREVSVCREWDRIKMLVREIQDCYGSQ